MSVYFLSFKMIGILFVSVTLHTSENPSLPGMPLIPVPQTPTYPHPAVCQVILGSKSLAWLETAWVHAQSFSCVQLFVTPPDSSVHGIFLARILEWVLHWQADSLPLSHLKSPKITYKDRFHFNLGTRLTQDMKIFEVHTGFLQLLE